MPGGDNKKRSVVVLGAGVIGLSIAHALTSETLIVHNDGNDDDDDVGINPKGKSSKRVGRIQVTVVARELPEQHLFSQGWASPWAGANWSPIGPFSARQLKWEKACFEKLWSLIPTGQVKAFPSRVFYESRDSFDPNPWWKDIVRDFREIPKEELPARFRSGAGLAFTTISVLPKVYLKWLKDALEERGVKFIHKQVSSIEEAATLGNDGGVGEDSIVINATGLGAKSLIGVEDEAVYPIRGQTIIVHAPHVQEFLCVGLDDKSKKYSSVVTYTIPRPDGTCILGGTFQEHDTDLHVNHTTAQRIFEQCSSLEPKLKLSEGTRILSHNVGLRPSRRGGARVELEEIELPLKNPLVPFYGEETRVERKLKVIHAYGLGPAGYQASWGVAEEVVEIFSGI